MLTQFSNTRPGYFSRIMAFPLLLLLCCAFATSLRQPDRPLPAPPVTSAPSLPKPSSSIITTSQDSCPPLQRPHKHPKQNIPADRKPG